VPLAEEGQETQKCITQVCVIQLCMMENPFEFGRELGTDELVDRQDEVAAVIETIRHGGKLFLIGPRRYGKTSILKTAEDRLEGRNAVILRFDAESFPSLDLLVAALIAGAAKSLKGKVERVGEQVARLFSKLRPELSFSVTQDSWSARLGVNVATNSQEHVGLLIDALNGLEELAREQPEGRVVGLIIDEFQRLIEIGGLQAESQIRAAIQRHRHVGYVFAGSKTRMLTDMTMDATRPFYRLGTIRFIGAVPRHDFEAFLLSKFEGSGFAVGDSSAITRILDFAEDVPYNVQLLAHTCWDQLRSRSDVQHAALTAGVVTSSMLLIARQYDPFYTQIWAGLTAIQQKTLVAIINEHGARLQSLKVAQFIGKGASTVQRSVSSLIEKDVVREEEHEGGMRLRFEDPFFGQWIRAFPGKAAGLLLPQSLTP
jgi:AAA+ ATPase superfamily predicted ATPase